MTEAMCADISPAAAVTLDGLFRERVKRTPDAVAYRAFNAQHSNWRDYTWEQIDRQVARWQAALESEGLKAGDRVAVMLRNCPEWVVFDQAALGLGLVVVPLYTQDRCDNVAYILNDADCKVLLFGTREQWLAFADVREHLGCLKRILALEDGPPDAAEPRLRAVSEWLPDDGGGTRHVPGDPGVLATIVYTSGTTGRPKGVMLSHRNILTNADACIKTVQVDAHDVLLSFLPLSHMFERTCGYYLAVMCGATTVYARSVQQLGEDLQSVRPTKLISVPRIYERIYGALKARLDAGPALQKKIFEYAVNVGWARFEHAQGRGGWRPGFLLWPLLDALVAGKLTERLGGRLKAAFAGGAPLPPDVARVFIGLGLPIIQGYGMTETSPVCCANSSADNLPASVGRPVPGIELKIGERNALMVKGPNVMLGYWNNEEATRAIIDGDGWLNSGDTARLDEAGRVYITGRLKEIIVMSNGEKLPPADIESAICRDPLFEHVILIGEGKPYLTVLTSLNLKQWHKFSEQAGFADNAAALGEQAVQKALLGRIAAQMKEFPGYAQVRRLHATLEPWNVENGLLTPTLKLRRTRVMEKFQAELDEMYSGH